MSVDEVINWPEDAEYKIKYIHTAVICGEKDVAEWDEYFSDQGDMEDALEYRVTLRRSIAYIDGESLLARVYSRDSNPLPCLVRYL